MSAVFLDCVALRDTTQLTNSFIVCSFINKWITIFLSLYSHRPWLSTTHRERTHSVISKCPLFQNKREINLFVSLSASRLISKDDNLQIIQ